MCLSYLVPGNKGEKTKNTVNIASCDASLSIKKHKIIMFGVINQSNNLYVIFNNNVNVFHITCGLEA